MRYCGAQAEDEFHLVCAKLRLKYIPTIHNRNVNLSNFYVIFYDFSDCKTTKASDLFAFHKWKDVCFVCCRYLEDTLKNKDNRVGSVYSKYVYKLYTNASYLEEIPNPPSFGYVGPLMRAEVGEVMKVHFRNKIPHPVTVHPHGVRYDKSHEGILFLFHCC